MLKQESIQKFNPVRYQNSIAARIESDFKAEAHKREEVAAAVPYVGVMLSVHR